MEKLTNGNNGLPSEVFTDQMTSEGSSDVNQQLGDYDSNKGQVEDQNFFRRLVVKHLGSQEPSTTRTIGPKHHMGG